MFYIKFYVKGTSAFSRMARVSVDNGRCFDVMDGDMYRIESGREYTLKIYQSTDRRIRKNAAWTVPLSGKDEAYCVVNLFPYNTDPQKTGAPHFEHHWTPNATYKQEMQRAAETMSRGEYNVFMQGLRIRCDNFAPEIQRSRPVPR